MKKLLLLLFTSTFLLGCSNDDDVIHTEIDEVNIRIKNGSAFNYKDISVYNVDYGNLNSGEFSEYKTFETTYRYANVGLFIEETEYSFQPYDYVGETPLENGNYTYILTITDGNVVIELVRD